VGLLVVNDGDEGIGWHADHARLIRRCAVLGCTNHSLRGHRLCAHHLQLRQDHGSVNATPRPKATPVTDAQRTEIIRRMRAFESPSAVALTVGVSKQTVLKVMRQR
jgi:hypothetical protein